MKAISYRIDGVEYSAIPPYLEKDGFIRPVIAEFFNIEEIEVDITDSPQRITLKEKLSEKIDALNLEYPELGLSISDGEDTAILKIVASGMTEAESVYLEMLYRKLQEV